MKEEFKVKDGIVWLNHIIYRELILLIFAGLPSLALAQSPEFTSDPVTTGVVNEFYRYHITTKGWWFIDREIKLTHGKLPKGIELVDFGNGTGVLQGVPEEVGEFPIELTVRLNNDKKDKDDKDDKNDYNDDDEDREDDDDDRHRSDSDKQKFTLVISRPAAEIVLSNMTTIYDGEPHTPKITTKPEGLKVEITYDGSPTPPTAAGNYKLQASIEEENYRGTAEGTMIIKKAPANIALNDLTAVYDGKPKQITTATTPPGLEVEVTYNGSQSPPVAPGNYSVEATISERNYRGSVNATLVITREAKKKEASIILSDMTVTYDGHPQKPAVSTDPEGLDVEITYDGASSPPVNAGTYDIEASIDEKGYKGSAKGTLTIQKATALITLYNLEATYDGTPKPVAVRTAPSDLQVTITYDGSDTPPTAAGTYQVSAIVSDRNYRATADATLVIKTVEDDDENKEPDQGENIPGNNTGRPVITNVEKDPLMYLQGDPAVPVSETAIINDFDDTHMYEAKITVSHNYRTGEDVLRYTASNGRISGAFDAETGTLTLSGVDTRSNYEMAIANVLYENLVIGETSTLDKTLTIVVRDSLHYSDPVAREIEIQIFQELDIVNAFTPNGDNINDYWNFIDLDAYASVVISVFNKDGLEVFSCSEYDCAWDGRFNGKMLPPDVYFYAIDVNNGKRQYRGTVTLLR